MAAAQRCSIVSLIGLLAAGLMLVPVPAAADRVLQTFHADRFVLDLAIAKCRSSECPIQVRLRKANRVVDRVTLLVAAGSQRAKAEIVDTVWGADVGRRAWATGEENSYVSTAARLLRLAPRTTGLLVSQQYGFEHLKRNHVVILPRAGKLTIAWKAVEGAGPTWSATQIIGSSPDRREIVYFRGFYDFDEDAADRLDAVRLTFHATSARLRETALPTRTMPLYLLNLGIHETVAQAREARSADPYCLTSHWVLDASRFRADASGKAIVGSLYATRSAAEEAARSAKSCLPDVTAAVETWTRALEQHDRNESRFALERMQAVLTAASSSHGPVRPSVHSRRVR